MTRTRKPDPGRRDGPDPSQMPLPAVELLAAAREVRGLLEELDELTAGGGSWPARVLRRNVELALLCPETLAGPDNQLDFVEELSEAVWDPVDGCLRHAVLPGSTPEASWRREERRRAVAERLGEIAHGLCAAVEAWREPAGYPQDEHSLEPGMHSPSPGSAQPLV